MAQADQGRARSGREVSDPKRPPTDADRAAQAKRTAILAELEKRLAAREARYALPPTAPDTGRLN